MLRSRPVGLTSGDFLFFFLSLWQFKAPTWEDFPPVETCLKPQKTVGDRWLYIWIAHNNSCLRFHTWLSHSWGVSHLGWCLKTSTESPALLSYFKTRKMEIAAFKMLISLPCSQSGFTTKTTGGNINTIAAVFPHVTWMQHRRWRMRKPDHVAPCNPVSLWWWGGWNGTEAFFQCPFKAKNRDFFKAPQPFG